MGDPFLGELRLFGFSFPPRGWAFCNGQILAINQNQALFALLGTTYGGNGVTTFALPNMQGRVPIHRSSEFVQGQAGGELSHTVTQAEYPSHSHTVLAYSNPANSPDPTGRRLAETPAGLGNAYGPPGNAVLMAPGSIGAVGGSQPHENEQPYLTVNFCIALQGIFPSRN